MRPLLALTIALFALAPFPALAAGNNGPGTISMSGKGEVSAPPDTAFITSGVTTQDKTARAALDANTTAMSALLGTLKAAKIDPKDIQTTSFSVSPQYIYNNKPDADGYTHPPRISGYQVQNSVNVKVRKLDDLGAILDAMVSVGANAVSGVSFSVEDPTTLLTEARKAAFEDAKNKATTYANAAGVNLGKIVSISENANYAPRPFAPKMMAARIDAAPVPVEAGQLSYDVSVAVKWTLRRHSGQ